MTRGRWSLLLVLALAGAAVGGLAIFARTADERVVMTSPPPRATPSSTTTRPALATAQTATGPRYAAFDCTKPAGIAARVDDAAIQLADLCARLQRLGGVTPQGTERQQARHVLDRMIDAVLVHRALDRAGAAVTESELTAALAAMHPKPGADVELLGAQLRERLELKKLVALRGADIAITEHDVDAELASGAPGIARGQGTQVEGFLARIAPGTDESAARQRAEAFAKQPSNASGMTPLAPFVVGDSGIEPALEAAAAKLRPGTWSTALRTRVGYAVIRVIGEAEGEALDTPALRARVRSALEIKKLGAAQQRVLEALRAAARIEMLVDV
jgi:hypothetical protein